MMPIEFKLNGQTVVGRPDEKIIETAKKHGVTIPHLCHGGNQRSDGSNLLTGSSFKTWNGAVYGEYGWTWLTLYGAAGSTGTVR